MALQISPDQVAAAIPTISLSEAPVSQLRAEYQAVQILFSLQPASIQRFLKNQGSQLATAFSQHQTQFRFELPDRIIIETIPVGEPVSMAIPAGDRQHTIGGLVERLARNDMRLLLRRSLTELELGPDLAIATAARLIRFVTAGYLIDEMLPSGRSVIYTSLDREDIPSIPVRDGKQIASAITAESDAMVIDEESINDRGSLQVPYARSAQHFYLPQWVPFDEAGHLLVGSTKEAEAHLASMQNYLEILHAAVALAPYMVANPLYQQKRSGMLGQLVNQGRIYASYVTTEVIQKVKQRAASQELNRGLSLSLPYFDDQALQIYLYHFDIIPAGRVMFVSAFVTLAARQEQVKVAQDTRLSPSTRKYLLRELEQLEKAFA